MSWHFQQKFRPVEPAAAAPVVAAVFDPSTHTVAEVLDYVDAHPDEAVAVCEAEAAGKHRQGILHALDC